VRHPWLLGAVVLSVAAPTSWQRLKWPLLILWATPAALTVLAIPFAPDPAVYVTWSAIFLAPLVIALRRRRRAQPARQPGQLPQL